MLHSMEPRIMAYNLKETSNNRHLILSRLLSPSKQLMVSEDSPIDKNLFLVC